MLFHPASAVMKTDGEEQFLFFSGHKVSQALLREQRTEEYLGRKKQKGGLNHPIRSFLSDRKPPVFCIQTHTEQAVRFQIQVRA